MARYRVLLIAAILAICILFGLIKVYRFENDSTDTSDTIEYVSMWNPEETHVEYLRMMASAFEKETGIKVKLVFSNRDVLTKIKSRLLMGNPPDLIEQEFCEFASAVTIGTIQPADLTDMFYQEKGPEGQERLIDLFGEERIDLYRKDGKLYFFPYEFITAGFFYDRSLYEKYGLQAPLNWSDFIKNNEVLHKNNIEPLALDGSINFYNAYYYCFAVERVMGPNAFRIAAEDTDGDSWDDPGYLKAAQMIYQLSQSGMDLFQDDYEKSEWPTAQTEWAAGKYGNVLCYTWIPDETKRYTGSGFKYDFYPFPEVENGSGKITDLEVGFIGCAIPKDSKKIEMAKSFLKFIIQKKNAQEFIRITSNISARLDTPYPEELLAVQDAVNKAERIYKLNDGVWADLPQWWANVFLPLDNKLIFGELTPEEFISQIKRDSILFWNGRMAD